MAQSLHTSKVAHQARAYPCFISMKRLGRFLLPPEWDASPSQGSYTQQIKFVGTCLYTWVKRGTSDPTQCPRPGLEPRPLDP